MIHVENLAKNFGNVHALNAVTFTINKGEVIGFLGPNGAGKTTAMRCIAGYLSPTEGKIKIDGVDIEEEPLVSKARIGYLPEQPPVYPEMNVRDYLIFVARIKGVAKENIHTYVEEAMDAVQITDMANRVIRNLSKGYRQRVGLAGALVHKPEILILDEPTVGLDPNQIIEIRKLISSLKADDRTLIISTHILAEVEQTCEKVIIINKGQIAAIGTKEELLREDEGINRLEVEVARNADGAKNVFENLNGVKVDTINGSKFSLSIPAANDLREEISKKLVDGGMGLLSMNMQKLALEDIFTKLTQEASDPVEVSNPDVAAKGDE